MDPRLDAARGNGDVGQQLFQLGVGENGQLDEPGVDAHLLVVPRDFRCHIQNLGRQVLEHRGHVHGRADPDAFRVVASAQLTVHPGHREQDAGAGRLGYLCHDLATGGAREFSAFGTHCRSH